MMNMHIVTPVVFLSSHVGKIIVRLLYNVMINVSVQSFFFDAGTLMESFVSVT